MINIVHGDHFSVDQWTGESFRGNKFKIPTLGLKKWAGCYSCPSTAMAALITYCAENNVSKEEHTELFDHFESTLRRTDYRKDDAFVINVAQPFRMLSSWGGNLSLEQYKATCDMDEQRKIYFQELPTSSVSAPVKDDSSPVASKNLPKPWFSTALSTSKSDQGDCKSIGMPRCCGSWLEFLRGTNPCASLCPTSVIVYFHPTNPKIFAVGSPLGWVDGTTNRRGTEVFGGVPVFGNVHVFHKNPLKEKRKKPDVTVTEPVDTIPDSQSESSSSSKKKKTTSTK